MNSVALMLWLLDHEIACEAVYADHGGDWPHAGAYLALLRDNGYHITVLETRRAGLPLYEYCISHKIMPSRWQRWCTSEYKVKPLRAYFDRPAVVYLTIDAGEAHRAKPSGDAGLEHVYPLIDEGIDRAGCAEIITDHGLPVPGKSTRYFCPYQSRQDFLRLRREHPDLYCKARALEDGFNARRREENKSPAYLYSMNRPLSVIMLPNAVEEFHGFAPSPCLCEVG